ncbi:hypothetical protein [Methanolobus bombayensis]|uniref:hypothetical protein n=1 Tax=Methanolobus bombayensis TaxID=38023 RepID=UPI001AE6BF66|nr:hypothetical protein [Methanolobus bombayensis]MBP1908668.1 hypothetical protein [Methanolobus bombayensis]
MKRLTISMSDELFDKLNAIENKSLFIRKLVERELDAMESSTTEEAIPWSESFGILKNDVNIIFGRLEEMENKLAKLKDQHEELSPIQESANMQQSFEEDHQEPTTPINTENEPVATTADASVEEVNVAETREEKTAAMDEAIGALNDIGTENNNVFSDSLITPKASVEANIPSNEESEIKTNPSVEPSIQEQILSPETAPYAPAIENTVPTGIDIHKPPEQVMPENKPQIPENGQEPELSVPMPEMEKNSNTEPPEDPAHEHKLSELVMEKINKTDGEDQNDIAENEIQLTSSEQTGHLSPEEKNAQPEFKMPDLKPPEMENEQTGFQIPDLKPPEMESEQSGFQMPDLKPPEMESEQSGFQMPDLKPPEMENEQTGFQIPDLKPPEMENGTGGFVIPEFEETSNSEKKAEKPDFAIPDLNVPDTPSPNEQDQVPPFMASGTEAPDLQNETPQMPSAETPTSPVQNSDSKPDKLETNILMYMPRGAKVKKEIIKSLVSRQFSQDDIEKKIQELVVREILVLKQENGVEQLQRLK